MKKLIVSEQYAKFRLDKWLATVTDLSRSRLSNLITTGNLTHNNQTITDTSLRVKSGQEFILKIPEATPALPEAENIPLDILYEDEYLLVINKPAGLVVHPAAGNYEHTLVNALLAHCGDSLSGIGGVKRPGIVHRIDKDTSGIIVVAKTDAAHNGLSEQFAVHSIERSYYALVWGLPSPVTGTITGNIARSSANRKKMAIVQSGGKHAVTHYKVCKTFMGGIASLVECTLETGRTHQIRVHLTSKGHALIGDSVYGGRKKSNKNAAYKEQIALLNDFPRQALHAFSLGFIHPINKKRLFFKSDLSNDFKELISKLE